MYREDSIKIGLIIFAVAFVVYWSFHPAEFIAIFQSEPEISEPVSTVDTGAISYTAPRVVPDTTVTEQKIYITPTGSKYHYRKTCAGKRAFEPTDSSVFFIYDPCKKCVH